MRYQPFIGQPPLGYPFTLNTDSNQAKGLQFWMPLTAFPNSTLVPDLGRRRASGTLTGGGVWKPSETVGWSIEFDGTDDYINFGSSATLGVSGNPAYSYGGWVYPITGRIDGQCFSYGNQSVVGDVISFGFNGGLALYQVHIGYDWVSSLTLSANTWYHVFFTYTPSTRVERLYINGIYREQSTLGGDLAISQGQRFYISRGSFGSQQYANNWRNGEMRFYDRILSDAEVWALWNPQTRWELYAPLLPSLAVSAPVVASVKRLTLLGVGD